MRIAPRSYVYLSPAAAIFLLLLCTGAPAQDVTAYPELPRFEQVSDRLFRGAQPRAGGVQRLVELGINTVINLRGASNSTRVEEVEARKVGLNYFNLSLPNWGRPDDGRIRHILELIAAPESGKVFVHCKDGVDRTGTVVALHRKIHLGWTTREALAEAERHGMRRIQFWMRDYVEDYHARVHAPSEMVGQYQESDNGFEDRVGSGVRIAERGVFRVRKIGGRVLRKLRKI